MKTVISPYFLALQILGLGLCPMNSLALTHSGLISIQTTTSWSLHPPGLCSLWGEWGDIYPVCAYRKKQAIFFNDHILFSFQKYSSFPTNLW